MVRSGDRIELQIDKPAAGGRMIARHDGQVVLVSGAIPGERVRARIERADKRLAFATTVDVLEASPDRRDGMSDPSCGGCLFSHIDLARQRLLKAEIIADAFARIGKHALDAPVPVAASPAAGYRLRARLHVREDRIGFYREGTHDLCDAAATKQLLPASLPAVQRIVHGLLDSGHHPVSAELSESIAADQRALLVELSGGARPSTAELEALLGSDVQTLGVVNQQGVSATIGSGSITEPLAAITGGRVGGELRRSLVSFFQGNRFLIPALVAAVVEPVLDDGAVLDLYAGVGLFSLAVGAGRKVVAVEGHPASGADLRDNANRTDGSVSANVSPVEGYLQQLRHWPDTVIVDPPRTGLSREALTAVAGGTPRRLIYVSCDPATLARDIRALLDAGYRLTSVAGFDLFPNTPHVEALAVLDGPAAVRR